MKITMRTRIYNITEEYFIKSELFSCYNWGQSDFWNAITVYLLLSGCSVVGVVASGIASVVPSFNSPEGKPSEIERCELRYVLILLFIK